MINIKDQSLTITIDTEGSRILTSALSCFIDYKIKNKCSRIDCEDCLQNKHNLLEPDVERLSKEVLDLYFIMYKISMSTTKIPTLQEIKDKIKINL